jgi:ribosome assembly protein 1
VRLSAAKGSSNADCSFQRHLRRQHAAHEPEAHATQRILFESIDTAFQLFTLKGPLCAEPVEGLAFSIESVRVPDDFDGKPCMLPSAHLTL